MFKRIVHDILLPCSQATLLLEKQHAESISFFQSVRLKVHLLICKWCRAYQKKAVLLDKILKNSVNDAIDSSISDADIHEFKRKIKEIIKK